MNKKIILIGLTSILLILSLVLIYFLNKNNLETVINQDVNTSKVSTIQPILFAPNDPATMAISNDQSQIEWTVKGRFVKPFVSKGQFIVGNFVLMGDTSNQELPIWIGPDQTQILIGESEINEKNALITWSGYSLDGAKDKIPLNQPVEVSFVNYAQNGDSTDLKMYQDFWLDLNKQLQQKGSIILPPNTFSLWLYTVKIKI